MNYSEMSDFELNRAVGMATGDATVSEPVFNQVIRNSNGKQFDPCNSWADAGPVIEKNKICIMAYAGRWTASAENGAFDYISFSNENPRRAAMIVFLMM